MFNLICLVAASQPQDKRLLVHEISGNLDNDFLLVIDRYYTAGQDLTYRRVLNGKRFFNYSDSTKTLFYFRYGNKMFTPTHIQYRDIRYMDRPYCGWSFINSGFTRFNTSRSAMQLELEVGVVGRMSGMEKLQKWWHQLIGFGLPRGWDSQIRNEVVINLNYQYLKGYHLDEGMDLISSTAIFAGTGNNKLSQEITIRMGELNPLAQSTFFNGRLGSTGWKRERESFAFFGLEFDYVLTNIFIEGSLFKSNPSPFTAPALPFVFKKKFGLMHADARNSYTLSFVFLSKELEMAKSHGYAVMAYAYRFKF